MEGAPDGNRHLLRSAKDKYCVICLLLSLVQKFVALGQQTFARLSIMNLFILRSAYANVKNLVVSNSLCTFAVSFRDGEMLIYLYKPIIIN